MFHVEVFIEVAMITPLRQLIVEPVNVATGAQNLESIFNAWHYGLLLSALLVTGILHKLVTSSDKKGERMMYALLWQCFSFYGFGI